MRKRRIIIPAVAVVAMLGGWIWWAVATRPSAVPDPVYAGHPLSYWVDASLSEDSSDEVRLEPFQSSLDSNAVPYLVQGLKTRDGALEKAYDRVWTRLPGWLWNRLPLPYHSRRLRTCSCIFLADLEAAARPAIPELIRLLREDDDGEVRAQAAQALGIIGTGEDKPVIEALKAATRGTHGMVWGNASRALWHLSPEGAAKAGVINPDAGTSPTTTPAGRPGQ